ncbi:MAG: hypothetical protein R3Y29_01100 [bacterium]
MKAKNRIVISKCQLIGIVHVSIAFGIMLGVSFDWLGYMLILFFLSSGGFCCCCKK